jgi:tRNA uridine 5-carboxymethylaminomethyl modification enzyme
MIDDLVTQGTEEPYRMFTSRAEHRLLLGCDSVYERLSPVAERLGVLDDERKRRVEQRVARMSRAREVLQKQAKVTQHQDFELARFVEANPLAFEGMSLEEAEGVVSRLRYSGYIERQQREASRLVEDEALRIPRDISYRLPGLSREMVEKLSFVRPASLGQASRIPGVTPAAVAILRMHLRRGAPRHPEAAKTAEGSQVVTPTAF